jgi:hypothetical protein
VLTEASPQESVLKMPVWLSLILLVAVASGAFYLGRRTSPGTAVMARDRLAAPITAAVPTPRPISARGRSVTGAGITETGAGWVIYTSLDRLTDRPLFGARFANQTGDQLLNVLCADGRSVLALERGLVPSAEGASGNGKSVVSAIETSRRAAARQGRRLALRFDEAPAELADVAPRRPAAFLRRVAASRRIRTATDEFETKELGAFVERVIAACGFDSGRTQAAISPGPKGQP